MENDFDFENEFDDEEDEAFREAIRDFMSGIPKPYSAMVDYLVLKNALEFKMWLENEFGFEVSMTTHEFGNYNYVNLAFVAEDFDLNSEQQMEFNKRIQSVDKMSFYVGVSGNMNVSFSIPGVIKYFYLN